MPDGDTSPPISPEAGLKQDVSLVNISLSWPKLLVALGSIGGIVVGGYFYLLNHEFEDLSRRVQSSSDVVSQNMKQQGEFEGFMKNEEPGIKRAVEEAIEAARDVKATIAGFQTTVTGLATQESQLRDHIDVLTGDIEFLKSRLPQRRGDLTEWFDLPNEPDRDLEKPYNSPPASNVSRREDQRPSTAASFSPVSDKAGAFLNFRPTAAAAVAAKTSAPGGRVKVRSGRTRDWATVGYAEPRARIRSVGPVGLVVGGAVGAASGTVGGMTITSHRREAAPE